MSRILSIDTATDICTIAVSEGEKIVAFRDSGEERSHAVQLAVFIDELLKEINYDVSSLDAIAISKGPGSYTGLRIGVSIAKGICYGAGLPLISVSTLQAMCYGVSDEIIKQIDPKDFYFLPMLDARRMEVYSAVYSSDFKCIKATEAVILNEQSYLEFLDEKPVLFFGNGAPKFKDIVSHKNAIFVDDFRYSSRNMIHLAYNEYLHKNFEDVAYFEPFYLKDFVTTVSKKNILFPEKKTK